MARQNLNDFRTSSCWLPVAYGYLWIGLIISIICYCVDIYLCINLLAFNTWSGQIQPAIPLNIAKWIFTGCIILSLLILAYEWIRAIRVMRKGYIADSYLDPLAVRLQCIRLGKKGRGWRRFLVFGQLTKSKKGAEYVAIFTYFSFKYWIRILLAEGPRMVVNGLTIKALIEGHLLPAGANSPSQGHTPVAQFFVNFQILMQTNRNQAIVLLGMAWVCLIWVISFISFVIAICMYLLFLWHHIPTSLSHYLRKQIEGRVESIVLERMKKVRRKETERLEKKGIKTPGRSGTPVPGALSRTHTGTLDDTKSDAIPLLNRSATVGSQSTLATLPSYTSRPSTPSAPSAFDRHPHLPALTPLDTHASPSISAGMQSATPIDSALSMQNPYAARHGAPSRTNTQNSYASNSTGFVPSRMGTQNSGYSNRSQSAESEFGPNPYLRNVPKSGEPPSNRRDLSSNSTNKGITRPAVAPTPRSASAAPAPGPMYTTTNPQTGMPLPPRAESAGPGFRHPPRSTSSQSQRPTAQPSRPQQQPPPRTASAGPRYQPQTQMRNLSSPLSRQQPMDFFGPAPTARSFTAPPSAQHTTYLPYTQSPPEPRPAPIPRPGTAGGAFNYPERPKPAQRGWTAQSAAHHDGYDEPPAALRAGPPTSMRRTQTSDSYQSGNSNRMDHGAGAGYGNYGHDEGAGWNQGGGGGFRFDAI